jgi:PleD family two-component response regulator
VSLGIAQPPDAGLGLREWMEAADRALYESKHGGRNRTSSRDVSQDPGR